MAMTGSTLAEIIGAHQLGDITFTGIMHIGKQVYITDEVLQLPEKFKFTTEFSSRVASAEKFGKEYLVTIDGRLQSYSQEQAERFVSEDRWKIVFDI